MFLKSCPLPERGAPEVAGTGTLHRRQLVVGQRIGVQNGPAGPAQHSLANLGTTVVALGLLEHCRSSASNVGASSGATSATKRVGSPSRGPGIMTVTLPASLDPRGEPSGIAALPTAETVERLELRPDVRPDFDQVSAHLRADGWIRARC